MSRIRKDEEVPPKFNGEGNAVNTEEDSKSGTSNAPTLEDLMRKLEKLTVKNRKPRAKAKGKKTKGTSSSREEENSSFEEEVSKKEKKGRINHDKHSYNSMSFNYNNMSGSTVYTSIPVGKAPRFDGTNYNRWKHGMKNYLYSISAEVWQIVCDGVDFLDVDEQPNSDQLQKIHRNAITP
jgi:hypothetical protein